MKGWSRPGEQREPPPYKLLGEPEFWSFVAFASLLPASVELCPCCPGVVFVVTPCLHLRCYSCGHIVAGVRRVTVPYLDHAPELPGWSVQFAQLVGLRARVRGEISVDAFLADVWRSIFGGCAPGAREPIDRMSTALMLAEMLGLIERDESGEIVRPSAVMLRTIPWWPPELEPRPCAPAHVEVYA